MYKVDLNCDMGEGMGSDKLIMPFIQSANIACGAHAGNDDMIRETIRLAIQYGVSIGAHPGFADKMNFGRKNMDLPEAELYQLIRWQIEKVKLFAGEQDMRLHHVKPHGALYNMAAKDKAIARTIVAAIKHIDAEMILIGLSGSMLIQEADQSGLKTLSEVFADRTYQDDGSLTPRSHPNALIDETEKMVGQVKQMIHSQTVTTVSGKSIKINAETICIHGDGPHAVEFAKCIAEII